MFLTKHIGSGNLSRLREKQTHQMDFLNNSIDNMDLSGQMATLAMTVRFDQREKKNRKKERWHNRRSVASIDKIGQE
jgi:hypothetical protein